MHSFFEEDNINSDIIDFFNPKIEKLNNNNKSNFQNEEIETISKQGNSSKKILYILIELQRLFAYLQGLNQKAISTQSLTNSFGWDNKATLEQHDIHELNRY